MKIIIFIIILTVVFAFISFFYDKQLGAIPFLLLSILFTFRAWKIWSKRAEEQKAEIKKNKYEN